MHGPPSDPLGELLRRCTVRISTPNWHGTGFFVGPGLVLTCAHVLRGGDEAAVALGELSLTWLGRALSLRRILTCEPASDLALLEVASSEHPCVLLGELYCSGDDVFAYGFPGLRTAPAIDKSSIRCEPLAGSVEGETYAQNETLLKFKSAQVDRGMSGAALLNRRTGSVCGVVRRTRARSSDLGGYAIPTAVVLATIPSLRALQTQYHRQPSEWIDVASRGGKAVYSVVPETLGEVAARDVLGSGEHTPLFRGKYAALRASYASPAALFESLRMDRFQDRAGLEERVQAFMREENRGYLIVEGKAGLGKTAFMAHLVQKFGYCHHFIRQASTPEDMLRGVESLAAQLVRRWDLEVYLDPGALHAVADRSEFLSQIVRSAARQRNERAPGEPIVVLVDALDEAGELRENIFGLPEELPELVYVIASRRPNTAHAQRETRKISVEAADDENRRAMTAYLEAADRRSGLRARILGERSLGELLDKSRGVWIYLHHVVSAMEEGDDPIDLDDLPDGLWQYYARFWQSERKALGSAWDEIYLDVLGHLAAVERGLSAEQIVEMMGATVSVRALRAQLDRWRPLLDVREDRYSPYHASLRDFFVGHGAGEDAGDSSGLADDLARATMRAHASIADRALRRWGELEEGLPLLLESLQRDPGQGEDVRYLTHHLEGAGRFEDVHRLLWLQTELPVSVSVERPRYLRAVAPWLGKTAKRTRLEPRITWMVACEAIDNLAGLKGDIERAQRLATRTGIGGGSERQRSIVRQCRYALMLSSLRSAAAKIPAALLAEAARRDIVSLEYALARARQMPDVQERHSALGGIAAWLAKAGRVATAFELVKEMALEPGDEVSSALRALAPYAPKSCVREAIAIARLHSAHWGALGPLLSRLAELDEIEEALAEARGLPEPPSLTAAAALLAYMTSDERATVLERLRSEFAAAADPMSRPWIDFAWPYFEAGEKADLLGRALSVARALPLSDSWRPKRSMAMIRLLSLCTDEQRAPIVSEVLAAVMAHNLAESHLGEYERESVRVDVLARIVPYVRPEERRRLIEELCRSRHWQKGYVDLSALVPYLSDRMVVEAFRATPRWARDFMHVVPAVSDSLIREALDEFRSTRDVDRRGGVPWLEFCVRAQSNALRIDAWSPRSGLWQPGRTQLLVEMISVHAQRFSPEEHALALELIRKHFFGDEGAEALCALAPNIPPKLVRTAVSSARWMYPQSARAAALTALASHLPRARLKAAFANVEAANSSCRGQAMLQLVKEMTDVEREKVRKRLQKQIAKVHRSANSGLRSRRLLDMSDRDYVERAPEVVLLRLTLMQALVESAGGGRWAEIVDAALAVTDPARRPVSLQCLLPYLRAAELSKLQGIAEARLSDAEHGLSRRPERMAGVGPPSDSVDDDLYLNVYHWRGALADIVVRLGELGFSEKALDALVRLHSMEGWPRCALLLNRGHRRKTHNDVVAGALQRLMPSLSGAGLKRAAEFASRERIELSALALAQLGLYGEAVSRALPTTDGHDIGPLVDLIPLLPARVLLAPLEGGGGDNAKETSALSLFEHIWFRVLRDRSYENSYARPRRLYALARSALRLEQDLCYRLFCQTVTDWRGPREEVLDDLPTLLPIVQHFGGDPALEMLKQDASTLARCVP
jgi:hypothetical protein